MVRDKKQMWFQRAKIPVVQRGPAVWEDPGTDEKEAGYEDPVGEKWKHEAYLELGRMQAAQHERWAEEELRGRQAAAPGKAPGTYSASNGKPLDGINKGVTRSHLRCKR